MVKEVLIGLIILVIIITVYFVGYSKLCDGMNKMTYRRIVYVLLALWIVSVFSIRYLHVSMDSKYKCTAEVIDSGSMDVSIRLQGGFGEKKWVAKWEQLGIKIKYMDTEIGTFNVDVDSKTYHPIEGSFGWGRPNVSASDRSKVYNVGDRVSILVDKNDTKNFELTKDAEFLLLLVEVISVLLLSVSVGMGSGYIRNERRK